MTVAQKNKSANDPSKLHCYIIYAFFRMESKLVSIRSKIEVDTVDEMRQKNIYKNKIIPSRKMQNEKITKFG